MYSSFPGLLFALLVISPSEPDVHSKLKDDPTDDEQEETPETEG